jgi:hypothetical protein
MIGSVLLISDRPDQMLIDIQIKAVPLSHYCYEIGQIRVSVNSGAGTAGKFCPLLTSFKKRKCIFA